MLSRKMTLRIGIISRHDQMEGMRRKKLQGESMENGVGRRNIMVKRKLEWKVGNAWKCKELGKRRCRNGMKIRDGKRDSWK